jgi:hypothetical protein
VRESETEAKTVSEQPAEVGDPSGGTEVERA